MEKKTCGKPTRQIIMDFWTILQMRQFISCKFKLQPLRIWFITEVADEYFSFLWSWFYLCSASGNSVLRSSSKVVIHILPMSHFISCFTFLFIFLPKKALSHAYEDLTRNWILKYGTVVKIQVNPSFVWPVDNREKGKPRMCVGHRTGNPIKLILIYFLRTIYLCMQIFLKMRSMDKCRQYLMMVWAQVIYNLCLANFEHWVLHF